MRQYSATTGNFTNYPHSLGSRDTPADTRKPQRRFTLARISTDSSKRANRPPSLVPCTEVVLLVESRRAGLRLGLESLTISRPRERVITPVGEQTIQQIGLLAVRTAADHDVWRLYDNQNGVPAGTGGGIRTHVSRKAKSTKERRRSLTNPDVELSQQLAVLVVEAEHPHHHVGEAFHQGERHAQGCKHDER